ncbi:ElyC/SanA/YdcF family protein [Spirochaetia bacterium 38H-sp]|uniref:ElyC/SanA/YdcF family protein n=1 Tax=Rarispira pelagica TaxID=3141764 RepID=A0ABU9U9Q5_9SPIR
MLHKLLDYISLKKRVIAVFLLSVFIFIILFIIIANCLVIRASEGKTFYNLESIKKNKVGLLLGTSRWDRDGRINLYFLYRIEAAIELYKAAKIDFILVSGDNKTINYNEPIEFKKELVKRGIPEERIFLDYAGFRTLDSIVRAKEVFGQKSITIISQQFHNYRAIFLATYKGIDAVGYNAKDVPISRGFGVQIREVFARTKALWDLIIGVKPKFLGEKIDIE